MTRVVTCHRDLPIRQGLPCAGAVDVPLLGHRRRHPAARGHPAARRRPRLSPPRPPPGEAGARAAARPLGSQRRAASAALLLRRVRLVLQRRNIEHVEQHRCDGLSARIADWVRVRVHVCARPPSTPPPLYAAVQEEGPSDELRGWVSLVFLLAAITALSVSAVRLLRDSWEGDRLPHLCAPGRTGPPGRSARRGRT